MNSRPEKTCSHVWVNIATGKKELPIVETNLDNKKRYCWRCINCGTTCSITTSKLYDDGAGPQVPGLAGRSSDSHRSEKPYGR